VSFSDHMLMCSAYADVRGLFDHSGDETPSIPHIATAWCDDVMEAFGHDTGVGCWRRKMFSYGPASSECFKPLKWLRQLHKHSQRKYFPNRWRYDSQGAPLPEGNVYSLVVRGPLPVPGLMYGSQIVGGVMYSIRTGGRIIIILQLVIISVSFSC
jgi:hypothetical protein